MMKIYNTLTRQKEEFLPAGSKVRMFVCGPTVYDYIHIGNARTFVFFDVVAKYLRQGGYKVEYIQNITDVEDKIIVRAQEQGKDPLKLAREFENIFLDDMKALGVTAVTEYNEYARASDHINEVVRQVQTLIKKGHAYLIEGDGYYFDLTTFPEYGRLSGRTAEMADDAVSRVDENPNKRNKGDFALWKFAKPGEPSWNTELGTGRPGWHIEDTAITEKYFGPQYEIHGGGQDLIFPHHEAEIAQQASAAGIKPEEFVRYWMHTGFLVNKERKMSKSLGNFMTLNEALKKYSQEVLRFYFLSSHYRSPLDYSENLMQQSQKVVQRILEAKEKLILVIKSRGNEIPNKDRVILPSLMSDVADSMEDDFNTPEVIADLSDFLYYFNLQFDEKTITSQEAKDALKNLTEFNDIFGIIPESKAPSGEIKKILADYDQARQNKDYGTSGQLRNQIKSLGYEIEDTVYGPLVKKSDKK